MRRVVVDRANNHASRPWCHRPKRSASELSSLVACLHIFHLSGVSRFDPIRKVVQLKEVADRGNPSQFKPCLVGRFLHQRRDLSNLLQWSRAARARTPALYICWNRDERGRPSSITCCWRRELCHPQRPALLETLPPSRVDGARRILPPDLCGRSAASLPADQSA